MGAGVGKSYVYLLESSTDNFTIKIGKADDVWVRLVQIGKELFNCTSIKAIVCRNSKQANALERYLHTVFEDRRSPHPCCEDGWSEWFNVTQKEVMDFAVSMGHTIAEVNLLDFESKRLLVCGVGVNDADYVVTGRKQVNGKWELQWTCPYYRQWKYLLERCTKGDYSHIRSLPEDWLRFTNFKLWLHKSGIDVGGGVVSVSDILLYLKFGVCLPRKLKVLLYNGKSRGDGYIGVTWHKQRNKYLSRLRCEEGIKSLGLFDTALCAHQAWQKEKLRLLESEKGHHNEVVDNLLNRAIISLSCDISSDKRTCVRDYYMLE